MTKTNKLPYLILGSLFIIMLCLTWPGNLTPDSMGQYKMAQSGVYSDHHPAVMSFIWRYLDMLVQGSGLMLTLHFILLYSACFYGIRIFKNSKIAYLYALLPVFPIVWVYSFFIWKDVGFAFSFLFSLMLLFYVRSNDRKFTTFENVLFWVVLFYGTCVKFQAQYCAPVVIIGYAFHQFYDNGKLKFILKTAALIAVFFASMFAVNRILVPQTQSNHSWQYVKLYDLAAISVGTGDFAIPEAMRTKHYSNQKLVDTFNHVSVDDMVFPEDAILRMGQNEEERNLLWWTWAEQAVKHPVTYAIHRANNMGYALLSLPEFGRVVGFLDSHVEKDSTTYKVLYYAARVVGYLLVGHIVMAALSIAYLLLGIANIRKSWTAFPLIVLNATSFSMLSALYFFSMAGTPRYTYIVACLVSASHGFALTCLFGSKK